MKKFKIRELGKNILALSVGLFLTLILAFIAYLLVPAEFNQWHSTIGYGTADGDTGARLSANQSAAFNKQCFRIRPISTNSSGFRDDEWRADADFKIAVLGDSVMEALQISDGEHAAAILEGLLEKEAMNTGTSGFGAVTELITYRKHLRPLKPDVVILFFLEGNDVRNNQCDIERALQPEASRPCALVEQGGVALKPPRENLNWKGKLIESMRGRRFVCYKFLRFLVDGKQFTSTFLSSAKQKIPKSAPPEKARPSETAGKNTLTDWYVYAPPASSIWEDAWTITESTLATLKKEVESDGGKLLVVTVPSYLYVSPDRELEMKKHAGASAIPEGFDVEYPLARMTKITGKNGISFLPLEPVFIHYRKRHAMAAPYFSYRCDGHWNPVAHFLAANTVAKYLIESGLAPLPAAEKRAALKKIEKNLSLPPREILGEVPYRQIYEKGIYRGASNIKKILRDE